LKQVYFIAHFRVFLIREEREVTSTLKIDVRGVSVACRRRVAVSPQRQSVRRAIAHYFALAHAYIGIAPPSPPRLRLSGVSVLCSCSTLRERFFSSRVVRSRVVLDALSRSFFRFASLAFDSPLTKKKYVALQCYHTQNNSLKPVKIMRS
jgi:hypothetical protein